ncbi:MAG TPA: response regulator transcription factor [Chitinophagaceae bacterium]|jgi:DNA-binding NarL/FixJ family response regulator|nr:response regulator transcription factor [Chitinophagaceae bacterium]HMU60013.1 response regulator transcription factor [Chitinophagaceae bacterium]
MPSAFNNGLLTIAIADDHTMFRQAIAATIDSWEHYKVIIQAANGAELLERINPQYLPAFALVDLNMPVMNGYETAKALQEKYPEIKVVILSMFQSEEAVLQLLQYGISGFLHKHDEQQTIKKAFAEITKSGYFFSDHSASAILRKKSHAGKDGISEHLTDREWQFLKLLASEKTYKEIATELRISERQTEYLRDDLFLRFGVKSRTGLAMTVHRKGLAV